MSNDNFKNLTPNVPILGKPGPIQPIRMTETDMKQRFLKFVGTNGKNIYVRMFDFLGCEFTEEGKATIYTTQSYFVIDSTKLPVELGMWKVEG